jgi:hypothetical protein
MKALHVEIRVRVENPRTQRSAKGLRRPGREGATYHELIEKDIKGHSVTLLAHDRRMSSLFLLIGERTGWGGRE